MSEEGTATGRAAWQEWANRELAVSPEKRSVALDVAMDTLQSGAGPHAAVVAARLRAGVPVPLGETRALLNELQGLERVVLVIGEIQPSGDLTAAGLAQLQLHLSSRLETLRKLYGDVSATTPGTATARAGVQATRPPGPSMREFFADNSILIISIVGAFLLIVATLLFEIYGTTGFGNEVRFAGVFVLNLVFGGAGYLCLRRPRLKLVGQTYIAIFALMAPLTVAAAYVFLSLAEKGVPTDLAVGIGGIGCSILYAILGARLGSRGYAALSLLALPVGWWGLLGWLHAGTWTGPWLVALVFAYIAIRHPVRQIDLLARLAEPFVHGAALLALGWSLVQATSEWSSEFTDHTRPSFQLSATLGLLTGAYLLYWLRSRRNWMLWTVWAGFSLTLLAINEPLDLGQRGYAVELALLAWAYAITARWITGRKLRVFVRIGAAVQAVIPIFLSASPDGLQAAVLLTASGVGLLFALEDHEPLWLLLALGIFSVAWFWLAKTLLPPPPNPTPDTLILTYSPLPVVYALIGLGLRIADRRRWSWPLYGVAALVAVSVAVSAISQNDPTLAGRSLLVYAGFAYVVSALDRFWPGLLAALFAAAGAVLLLLAAASTAAYWYPTAMTALAILIYGAHRAWGTSALAQTHRYSALAMVGLTAAFSFTVPDFWLKASAGSITALVSLVAAAALLFVEGRLFNRPLLDYVAPVVASLGAFWVARYVGIHNVQAYVALLGVTLIALGALAPQDRRHPADLVICRAAVAAGAAVLMGASAYQSVTTTATASHTTLWVIEAVAAVLIGIWLRSRTLVVAGGAGLALGALRALFLILESVQLYVVFGVIALLLLAAAGVLAATRDRLAVARSAVTRSWEEWS